ncbi:MAG TPA: hypothetical protein VFY54_19770, partial [Rubrobacter sp.]|nr:hypothetical protein [Rubrobacter sp.]
KEIQEGQRVTLTVSFEDGVSREVDVAADEAEGLRTKGRDRTPWYTDLGRKAIRPAVWVLALVVTSLLIPAITKQWADRPKELELRTALVDRIGESAAQTINTARFIVADTTPEATLRAMVCGEAEETEDPAQVARCRTLQENETFAEQTAHINAKSAWLQKGAVLESQLAAYFPGSDLSREGKAYVNAVRIYLFLASGVCDEKREESNGKLLRYLGENPADPTWAPLYDLTEEECAQKSSDLEFRSVYGPLGDQMLAKRLDLLELLNESDAEGFSVGFMDFFSDALPAVILLLAAGVVVVVYVLRVRRRMT